MEAEGGGAIGRVPSSILVQVDLPPHPPNLPLFVASAEFLPAQAGDLGLARGTALVPNISLMDDGWIRILHRVMALVYIFHVIVNLAY